MAKELEKRRQAELVRRENKLKEKRRKTENRAGRGNQTAEKNIPKPKKEQGRRKYDRGTRPIKPAVSVLVSSVASCFIVNHTTSSFYAQLTKKI